MTTKKTEAQQAFLLCKDPLFQHFLNERSFVFVHDEETARHCVLEGCQIKSRSRLDKCDRASGAWLEVFYRPFLVYSESLEKVI